MGRSILLFKSDNHSEMWPVLVVLVAFAGVSHGSWYNVYPKAVNYKTKESCGSPLFLTPYIENGTIDKGRKLAEVPSMKGGIESYAGYLTVNKEYNSNLFFWFFPARKHPETAPVVLWLQGGPGASSIYAIFNENGPYRITNSLDLKIPKYYWTKDLSVIYIDNPVGTGFSFTQDDRGYATNEVDVGNDLFSALEQFFQLFPSYSTNDFFITGESYAGKYVPAAAYSIHKNNSTTANTINLKGIAIGNGLVDPVNMMKYGDYLYEIGLIDASGKEQFQEKESIMCSYINNGQFREAFDEFDELLNGDLTPYPTLFYNLTGYKVYFDYLLTEDDNSDSYLNQFLGQCKVRSAIHVGDFTYNDGSAVEKHLLSDVMDSVKPWFEELLESYRVLLYNGQLDIIVAYPLTVNFVQQLDWSGADEYKNAQRKEWFVGKELAGYTKSAKTFTEVLVRSAGHMVPQNQPKWAYDLIKNFAFGKNF